MNKLRFGVLCRGPSSPASVPAEVIRPIEEREPDAARVIDYIARKQRA
jgi:hypothetical protein